MANEGFLNCNGKIYRADKLFISPNNRSFRYGDGCFETIKMMHGKMILEDFHFERLFSSLESLQFEPPAFFTPQYLKEQIAELAKKNYHEKLARIRLMIFRGNGGLYDAENHFPNYLIQSWALSPANNELNENGLVIDIYKDARKICDGFSHIKSNNYLSYAMAAFWAKKNKLNDALLLNPYDKIADATIANVFIVKDGIIQTPAVTEGCVGGIMRRYLLKSVRNENMPVEETSITVDALLQAQEIFLTNAAYGIKWVKQCGVNGYTNSTAELLHKKFIVPIFK
ncbi:MAG TPA: aminotransferase class IV [Panacibacter sp.]|nr:aminotransferase class IV [Panacibacter sp.]